MMAWLDRARGLLRRERTASPQTYDDARAQLDGAAWRELPKSTDAWFIVDEPAAFNVAEGARSERYSFAIGACALLTASCLAVVLVLGGSAAPPIAAAVVTMPASAATAAPPPVVTAAASPKPTPALAAATPAKKAHRKHRHH